MNTSNSKNRSINLAFEFLQKYFMFWTGKSIFRAPNSMLNANILIFYFITIVSFFKSRVQVFFFFIFIPKLKNQPRTRLKLLGKFEEKKISKFKNYILTLLLTFIIMETYCSMAYWEKVIFQFLQKIWWRWDSNSCAITALRHTPTSGPERSPLTARALHHASPSLKLVFFLSSPALYFKGRKAERQRSAMGVVPHALSPIFSSLIASATGEGRGEMGRFNGGEKKKRGLLMKYKKSGSKHFKTLVRRNFIFFGK